MPKASTDEKLVSLLESRISSLQSFSSLLRSGQTLPEILEDLLGDLGLEILPDVQPVKFYCPCSRERVRSALQLLGEADLEEMIATDETAEANCKFCNEDYRIPPSELKTILSQLQRSTAL